MTEFSRAPNTVAGGRSVGAGADDARGADHGQASRWPGGRRACPALAVASALIAGASVYAAVAVAQDVPDLNRIWAGCVLSPEAIEALSADLVDGRGIGTPEVAFVVVYSLNNDNDGQPVTVGSQEGFTGPVICRNDAVAGNIAGTTQTADIGGATILDAEEAFLLRFQSGSIEKRVCHTVNNNTDCFRISP